MDKHESDPWADRTIKERGGIVGIWESMPACVTFRLGDGSLLALWEGSNEHSRSWEIVAHGLQRALTEGEEPR